jgi:polyketide-type polyunsaturated fatty acid synthase PfaA
MKHLDEVLPRLLQKNKIMNIEKALKNTPIAVVGLSAMFADAKNIEEFWTNIVQSKDSITEVPDSRWAIADYYDADMHAPDKTYCKRGGFLPQIDFDPMEFGLPPNILEVTDVSQLLSLVAARDAFEDAGYGQNSAKFTRELRDKTGVVLGVGGGQKLITPLMTRLQYPVWEKALRTSGIAEKDIAVITDKIKKAYVGWNENSFPGMLGNVISGRITNRFDLGGLNSVVDAACAASLSAIRMAVSELAEGRCDMMLTGGVDTDNSPFMYMSFSKTPAFSKSGNIRPFDDAADGMLIGEGIGMLVLKRLSDAERDGDKIYALIKGIGASSDGRFKSVYAPRPAGQAMAMDRAYQDAGFSAHTVGLIEGHGTGTGAGDPTEFSSMQMVFGKDNPKKNYIGLGSVKSQIGHAKSAAGAAGMVKAVLALHHKVLPASINVTKPNTKFKIDDSVFYVNAETRPWFEQKYPRRAGVSAFGFGGVNLHFALEEYAKNPLLQDRIHTPYHSILIHAENTVALLEKCKEYQSGLTSANAVFTYFDLLQNSEKINIPKGNARLGFVAASVEETMECLKLVATMLKPEHTVWEHPKGIYFRAHAIENSNKVAALFSGQGAQYVGMGTALANAFPEVHGVIDSFDRLFLKENKATLSEYIYPNPAFTQENKQIQQDTLTQTQIAQPAIGAISMGMYKTLVKAGFKADLFGGHSFGELTALWAAGTMNDEQYRFLAKARGQAMSRSSVQADSGSMLAVKASEAQIAPLLPQLSGVVIANINAQNQLVLGGSTEAVTKAIATLKANGLDAVKLSVSAAFHTPFVGHAQQPFTQAIQQVPFATPTSPVYSNTSAMPYPSAATEMKTILSNHILQPVNFKTQIENMYAAGARVFVEFGPKAILTNLVHDILRGKEHFAVALNANAKKDSDMQFRQSIMQLQILGLPIGEVDTFHRALAKPKPLSKMNVKLSGNNYVSPATKQAYQDALDVRICRDEALPHLTPQQNIVENENKPKISIEGEKYDHIEQTIVVIEPEITANYTLDKAVPYRYESESDDETINNQNSLNHDDDMNKEIINLIKETVTNIQAQQSQSFALFERLVGEQNKQSLAVIEMLGKCFGEAQPQQLAAPITQTIALAATTTPIVPEPAIAPAQNGNGNGHYSNGNGAAASVVTKPAVVSEPIVVAVAPKPAPAPVLVSAPASAPVAIAVAPTAPSASNAKVTAILMKVVSEKTGYPAEMLELSMDMEADLGIDSIKRVEIFGAITEQHPELSNINPQELAELRTLDEIVVYISSKNIAPVAATLVVAPHASSATTRVAPTVANNEKITSILMKVVSEKTGYPAEMLELSMDMEADLGIDSIKRVEIFGAITEQHPEISGINPQELAELRTLAEIVDYMSKQQKKK